MSAGRTAHDLARFGVSMEPELLERFDTLIASQGYANRSEAIRDLVRNRLVEADWQAEDGEVVGAMVVVYDHEKRQIGEKLTGLQHQLAHLVTASLHIHLDARDCLEVIALKGSAKDVTVLANRLQSMKGVKHGRLLMTGAAGHAHGPDSHSHGE